MVLPLATTRDHELRFERYYFKKKVIVKTKGEQESEQGYKFVLLGSSDMVF